MPFANSSSKDGQPVFYTDITKITLVLHDRHFFSIHVHLVSRPCLTHYHRACNLNASPEVIAWDVGFCLPWTGRLHSFYLPALSILFHDTTYSNDRGNQAGTT